jgi:GT2 family glycosyltransferase
LAEEVSAPSVDIVIVNWNSGAYLRACVASIERSAPANVAINLIAVVDNASTDGSANEIETRLPLVIVRNAANEGFARACNRGAREGSADFLLFLNPDVELDGHSLQRAVDALCSDPGIAVAGIRLRGEDHSIQRTCCREPTLRRLLVHSIGLDRIPWFAGTGYVLSNWTHDETREVDHVIGAFYLIRRDVFVRLGGLDQRFFVYLEDLDLSMRVKALGFRIVFLADAEAFHAGGGTTRTIKATRLFYSLRSRLQYARKHHGRLGFVAVVAATLCIEPFVRLGVAGTRGSPAEMRHTVRGYWALIRWLIDGGRRETRLPAG